VRGRLPIQSALPLLMVYGGGQGPVYKPRFSVDIITAIIADAAHEAIHAVLAVRFGTVPEAVNVSLRTVVDRKTLSKLNVTAVTCVSLSAFRKALWRVT
jgi:hypothetical protein